MEGKKAALLFYALFSSLPLMAAYQSNGSAGEMETLERVTGQTSNIEINGALGKLSAVVYHPDLQEGERSLLVILMHGFMSDKQDPHHHCNSV